MKYKIMTAGILIAAFIMGLFGVEFVAKAQAQEADRLVGVYVTTEYLDLFDMDAYFNDNIEEIMRGGEISHEETAEYQGRLYAKMIDETETTDDGETFTVRNYEFPVEGSGFFATRVEENGESYRRSIVCGSLSDVNTHYTATDSGEDVALSGKLYCSTAGGDVECYFNPVYQAADGNVYLTSGSGYHFTGSQDEGGVYSQKIEEKHTVTVNDEKIEESISAEISIEGIHPTDTVKVMQYDKDGKLIDEMKYAADELPESITVDDKTEYIIAECVRTAHNGDKLKDRQILDKDDKTPIKAYQELENGFCQEKQTQVEWK